jgi:transcriptional regulator with XRE-family HTH domain
MENIHQRVTRAVTASGHTASSVARKIGVSPEAVGQWMKGPTKNLRNENLFALADATGFSARWIGTGQGPEIDRYSSEAVRHVLSVMESLPPAEQNKLSRMADAFAGPPANDHPPHGSVQQRKVDS